MTRLKPMQQDYANYTSEDFEVWEQLYNRQMELLKSRASGRYLNSLKKAKWSEKQIPDFTKTSEISMASTGWKMEVAKELVPDEVFFEKLSQRIFPATCWLRTKAELNYLEEPDMFHDVFGHVPLLLHPPYAQFIEGFGQMALKWLDDPGAMAMLSRFYWFTVEFGLISEGDEVRIYGAGIISSINETLHALKPDTVRHGFDIDRILCTDYRTDQLQQEYFVVDSYEELFRSLAKVEKRLGKKAPVSFNENRNL